MKFLADAAKNTYSNYFNKMWPIVKHALLVVM